MLGVRYRELGGDRLSAGPMHYLRDGLGMPRLGWLYALVAGVAALTTTPFTQPNSIAVVLQSELGVPTWVTGIVVAVLTWLVVIGGIEARSGARPRSWRPLKVDPLPGGRAVRDRHPRRRAAGGARADLPRGLLARARRPAARPASA